MTNNGVLIALCIYWLTSLMKEGITSEQELTLETSPLNNKLPILFLYQLENNFVYLILYKDKNMI